MIVWRMLVCVGNRSVDTRATVVGPLFGGAHHFHCGMGGRLRQKPLSPLSPEHPSRVPRRMSFATWRFVVRPVAPHAGTVLL